MARSGMPSARDRGETEYFMYTTSVGDPKLFVIADDDKKPYTEKFFCEFEAYHGKRGNVPRILDERHLPSAFTFRQKRKIPSMFETTGGFLVVDSSVRNSIEDLEPDAHQFIPARMIHKNGEEEPREFFILNVHRTVDAVALEQMGARPEPTLEGGVQITLPKFFERDVQRLRSRLRAAGHLFRDNRSWRLWETLFISREMIASIKGAGGRFASISLRTCRIID